ncbi:arabinosylfuranosidase ArfA [Agromyces aerolatus]|uniref:arabinosylfuranosidase ArfA n=1 Tax=Agromyces sp. LY-1074 TaxID=3074080 RepID=UPI0028677070|nr:MULTISPECIES: alpha-N-arabinofuranosidase [unclassified Agromyces]MDR5699391.1 alpha-N-arabinofuranosidase [Agromyces sp. LY-1074]MDR5705687.1 alpha-N-arabinofuranosidase [Agromyces sp. LY-1358]
MTVTARVLVDPSFSLGEIDPRIYGSFVEHMGRCVYDGIYDPEHATADEDGFRQDVAELVRELGPTILRYPGGNFVSGYRWEDGVGPREDRPVRRELAWKSIEPNLVGTNEFMRYCQRLGIEPMMAVNLGTRGIEAATALVEYTTLPGGTYWSDLRRSHGVEDPWDVRVWCLGNEMDGPWQLGHKTAYEYGRLAAETAVALRRVNPNLELVACGTSKPIMPTFGSWEAEVLEQSYAHVDYLSMHMYVDPDLTDDVPTLLAAGVEIDAYIDAVIASADFARARGRHSKVMPLSFDEWNVWYNSRPREIGVWPFAPELIGDIYTFADALVVGSFINSILRRSDRVRMACLAQLVNVIAPIRTEPGGGPAWRQSTFYPFALASRFGRGESLRVGLTSERHDTSRHEDVPALDVAAVHDPESGAVTFFVVNRDLERSIPLELATGGFARLGAGATVEHTTLTGPSAAATNSAAAPETIAPRTAPSRAWEGAPVEIPAMSWNMIRLIPGTGSHI